MKFEKRYIYYIILVFAACYAMVVYWNDGASIVYTIYRAAFPFLVGAGIAYIVNIVMSVYESIFVGFIKFPKLLILKRPTTMILAYFTFVFVIFWIFSIVLPDLISSINSLLSIDPSAVINFTNSLSDNELVNKVLAYFGSSADLSTLISNYSQQVLQQVLTVLTGLLTSATSIASTLINVFISLVFSFYVLASKEKLGRQFTLLIDTYLKKYSKTIHYVVGILHQCFHGFFVGQTIEATILGSLTAIGMTIFSLPYAPTIGVLIAFTALIPVVGAYIGVTIGFVLIATQSVSQALFFVAFLIILQQFEGNLIYPRVVGGSIGLPSMWVLLAITIGGALWGVLGMLLAVPIAASLYQIIRDNVAKHQASSVDKEVE